MVVERVLVFDRYCKLIYIGTKLPLFGIPVYASWNNNDYLDVRFNILMSMKSKHMVYLKVEGFLGDIEDLVPGKTYTFKYTTNSDIY